MAFLIIIGVLLFLGSIIFFIIASLKQINNNELKQERRKLQHETNELSYEYNNLTEKYSELKKNYGEIRNDYNFLVDRGTQLDAELKEKQLTVDNFLNVEKQKIQEQLEIFKSNSNYAMQSYISSMEDSYIKADEDFDIKIEKLNQEYEKIMAEIDGLRATLSAATEARLREEEKNGNLGFYMLQVTDIELDDIKKLDSVKSMLHNPVILSKLIWSTYYQKQYKALCSRVLGEDTVCGIYKITDLITEQYYIGQSVNIANRWSDHIKAGLGIDNNGSNKLYKAMQTHGVNNFTFELLESCERKLLDEKEKFFIGLYQSDKFGLNVTKGNG